MTAGVFSKLFPVFAAAVLAWVLAFAPAAFANQAVSVEAESVGQAAEPVAQPRSVIDQQPIQRAGPAGGAGGDTRSTTQRTGAGTAAGSNGFDVGRVLSALAVVVVLILLLRWVAKRFFGVTGVQRSTRVVQVLSRSALTPRQQVVLLRVGRRLLVVADGGGQMNTLSEITDPDEVATLLGQLQDDHSDRTTRAFGNLFGKMRKTYEPDSEQDPADAESAAPGTPADGRDREREEDADPEVASTRHELVGLMDKVRTLSSQYKSH